MHRCITDKSVLLLPHRCMCSASSFPAAMNLSIAALTSPMLHNSYIRFIFEMHELCLLFISFHAFVHSNIDKSNFTSVLLLSHLFLVSSFSSVIFCSSLRISLPGYLQAAETWSESSEMRVFLLLFASCHVFAHRSIHESNFA